MKKKTVCIAVLVAALAAYAHGQPFCRETDFL